MSVKIYLAPRIEQFIKQMYEIPFSALVAAGAYNTLVAGPIPFGFRVLAAKLVFTLEANNLVEHRIYVSGNNVAPTTDWATDLNIFGRLAPTAGFRGKGLVKRVTCDRSFTELNQYLKVGTLNGLGIAYRTNVTVVLQEI